MGRALVASPGVFHARVISLPAECLFARIVSQCKALVISTILGVRDAKLTGGRLTGLLARVPTRLRVDAVKINVSALILSVHTC